MPVVCEVGPAAVRLLGPNSSEKTDAPDSIGGLVDAALEAPGEPLTLVDDQPVRTEAVWKRVFDRVLAGADTAILVHPSWWAPTWVDSVAAAALRTTPRVLAFPRSGLLHRGAAFVEIAPDLVVVGDRSGAIQAESRLSGTDRVADAVVARVELGAVVHIDAPTGVPGAVEFGSLVADRLRAAGATVRHLDDGHLYAAASRRAPTSLRVEPEEPARRRGARAGVRVPAGLAALLAVAATAGLAVRGASTPGPAATGETILVEGRVAVRVPADWSVHRVTGGPGSARVQVVSPADSEAVLHITQSPVPTQDLAATAADLRIAADAQPPGVFVDFNPDDRRAGRPAVTYREVRPGHDIVWHVVVVGGVRVAIGCQNAPGRDRAVARACASAIESAHEIR